METCHLALWRNDEHTRTGPWMKSSAPSRDERTEQQLVIGEKTRGREGGRGGRWMDVHHVHPEQIICSNCKHTRSGPGLTESVSLLGWMGGRRVVAPSCSPKRWLGRAPLRPLHGSGRSTRRTILSLQLGQMRIWMVGDRFLPTCQEGFCPVRYVCAWEEGWEARSSWARIVCAQYRACLLCTLSPKFLRAKCAFGPTVSTSAHLLNSFSAKNKFRSQKCSPGHSDLCEFQEEFLVFNRFSKRLLNTNTNILSNLRPWHYHLDPNIWSIVEAQRQVLHPDIESLCQYQGRIFSQFSYLIDPSALK